MMKGVQLPSLAAPQLLQLIRQPAHLFHSVIHLAMLSNYMTDWRVLCDTVPKADIGVKAYDAKTLQCLHII